MDDYKKRKYLSAIELAKLLGITVREVHSLSQKGLFKAFRSASGQYRFDLKEVERLKERLRLRRSRKISIAPVNVIEVNGTRQVVYVKNAQSMGELQDDSVHLKITSPPYFDAKLYSKEPLEGDLGNIHNLDEWFDEISKVWREVYRVLQPGRKAFVNVMNLPVRTQFGFRSLNIVGRTIEVCEQIGFIFRREVVWHKTNSVRAHFGTYPYPGNILINYAHEFILEFDKPQPRGYKKFTHLTGQQKEASKLDKDFWISVKKSDVWLMRP